MIPMENAPDRPNLLAFVAKIVASFVGNHPVATGDLPGLIKSVFASLSASGQVEEKAPEVLTPAVHIKRSIGTDYIVCLEDGKKLKMLKRHLATRYNMTPDQYRSRWGLAADYPMVAPAYAEQRSALARKIGLGRKPASAPAPAPVAPEAKPAVEQRPPLRVGGRRKSA
jgi:predicted transcriptional regulator